MTHWPDLEASLQGLAGWRRVGREYHWPCPVGATFLAVVSSGWAALAAWWSS